MLLKTRKRQPTAETTTAVEHSVPTAPTAADLAELEAHIERAAAERVDDRNDRILESLHRSQAVIEFDPSGTIITANDNFFAALGYELHEIVG